VDDGVGKKRSPIGRVVKNDTDAGGWRLHHRGDFFRCGACVAPSVHRALGRRGHGLILREPNGIAISLRPIFSKHAQAPSEKFAAAAGALRPDARLPGDGSICLALNGKRAGK